LKIINDGPVFRLSQCRRQEEQGNYDNNDRDNFGRGMMKKYFRYIIME